MLRFSQRAPATIAPSTGGSNRVYSREKFRSILSRHTEWEVREALEEGNIPSSHKEEAIEWLEEQARNHRAPH